MAILEIRADFKALTAVLTRIADVLERIYPATAPQKLKPIGVQNYSRVTDEKLVMAQYQAVGEKIERGIDS